MALQKGQHFKYFFGSIIMNGCIECKTGLHIGGSSDTLEIGGIDKPVIRNPVTHEPYVPGSSLKGKLRSIVEKVAGTTVAPLTANRHGGDKDNKVWRHECNDFPAAIECKLCRIFGSTGYEGGDNWPALLLVRDGELRNPDSLKEDGIPIYEAKMENCLDRLTSAAHPRTIERVPAGAHFEFELVLRLEVVGELKGTLTAGQLLALPPVKNLQDDLNSLLDAMEILEHDGLGGNISRGSGQIEFSFDTFMAIDRTGKQLAAVAQKKLEAIKPEIPAFIKQVTAELGKEKS